ncbi:hypothetical protein DPMN_062139 [Dreissena polymorpha]|uniref:Uncharacterized protein n=1 Tax=Dreissena polymorpha TaxID=45954 RepID=A0A9D4C988_DREPO|nr:hypothetical protein DPMN_062139 [Dreissena polymorpha]
MARQRPTRITTPHGQCIVEIDRIVIREVRYQLEVNRAILGGCGLCGRGTTGLVMGLCIVEIDQVNRNRCRNKEIIVKGNFVWVWPIRAGRPKIDRIVIREVQYELKVSRCRNEEVIVKGNFGWVWPMWVGRLRIDRIVMHKFSYQFELNRCRNEEIIVKGNFGWVWFMWAGAPGLVMGPCIVEVDRIVIKEVQYQFEVNRCRNEDVNLPLLIVKEEIVARTDRRTVEITTISPRFSKKIIDITKSNEKILI